MRNSRAAKTIENLVDEGWTIDHIALFGRYKSSGSISEMKTRKVYKFCRVHHGEKIGHYQVTTVMRKEEG